MLHDSVRYRLSKFANRHRTGVAAASLATVALMGSTAVSAWYGKVAQTEKNRAERRFDEVRQLANFVLSNLDETIRQGVTPARKLMVSRALEYLNQLSTETGDDVGLKKEVIEGYLQIGDIQGSPYGQNLGDAEGARQSYTKALKLAKTLGKSAASESDRYVGMATRKLTELQAAPPAR